jgi:hypothetical protein
MNECWSKRSNSSWEHVNIWLGSPSRVSQSRFYGGTANKLLTILMRSNWNRDSELYLCFYLNSNEACRLVVVFVGCWLVWIVGFVHCRNFVVVRLYIKIWQKWTTQCSSKPLVAGSNPASRSNFARVTQWSEWGSYGTPFALFYCYRFLNNCENCMCWA